MGRCDTPSFTLNSRAAWLAPAAWIKWAWSAYLGVETAHEVAAALADPRVCPHTAPGGLDGIRGLPVLLVTSSADALHDEGIDVRDALQEAGAQLTHVPMRASHCAGWFFDKVASKVATAKLAEYLLSSG